jgi:hypothetical protein
MKFKRIYNFFIYALDATFQKKERPGVCAGKTRTNTRHPDLLKGPLRIADRCQAGVRQADKGLNRNADVKSALPA